MIKIEEIYKVFLQSGQNISTDNRKDIKGTLFFCLKGDNFDANKMAETAMVKEPIAVVTERLDLIGIEGYIIVNDALKTLQALATFHRRALALPIIAIGGSNGKTTTKELLYAILKEQFSVYATPGNFNNHIGVPLTLLQIRNKHEMAIVELGINHPLEMTELCQIAEPNFGLLTNIGKEHLEGLGDLEGVAKAESELFDYLLKNDGFAFINLDDPWIKNMSKRLPLKHTYSIESEIADTYIKAQTLVPNIQFNFENESINSSLSGDYNFANIVSAIAIAKHFKVTKNNVKKGVEQYIPSNSRSQWIKTNTNNLLVDCYNANPTSMELAIKNFDQLDHENKLFVIGDMLEMGSFAKSEHLAILNQLKEIAKPNKVFCVGETLSQFAEDFDFQFYMNSELLANHFENNAINDAYILLKASRGVKLEKIIPFL